MTASVIYGLFGGRLGLLLILECQEVAFGEDYGLDFCKGTCSEGNVHGVREFEIRE